MSRGSRSVTPGKLRERLEGYTVDILKPMAKLLASDLPTRKAELVALIHDALMDPERQRQLWASMDATQQAALAEAVHSSEGKLDAEHFRAKYGRDPNWGEFSRWGGIKTPSVLYLFIQGGTMPPDLQARLRAFVPPPRTARIATQDAAPASVAQVGYDYQRREQVTWEVPVTVCETEWAAQHDLIAVLQLTDAGKVRASATTRRVSAAGARAIAEVLQGGDFYPVEQKMGEWGDEIGPIKAFAWPLIVQAAGLAELAGTRLQLTASGRKALATPPHQVLCQAWKRWQKATLLDEFNRIHTIKGQGGKGKRNLTAPSGRRAAILAALAECPPHEWIAFDEFSRYVRATGHSFEVSRDLWSLYIEDAQYGSLGYSGYGEWQVVQERYMLAYLFEYAATLGLIDVAFVPPDGVRPDYHDQWGTDELDCLSRYDGLISLRINALGAWCLGMVQAYEPPPVEARPIFNVLANMEIVATGVLSPADALFLERIATPRSDFVWQIERGKLLEAAEQGYALSDLAEFLQARSANTLPDNVALLIREVSERASALEERGPALLFEARDAVLAQLIANDTRTRSLCTLAGEQQLVVPTGSERAFRRALRELGYGVAAGKR